MKVTTPTGTHEAIVDCHGKPERDANVRYIHLCRKYGIAQPRHLKGGRIFAPLMKPKTPSQRRQAKQPRLPWWRRMLRLVWRPS